MTRWPLPIACATLLALTPACDPKTQSAPASPASNSPAVAVVGSKTITADDLKKRLDELPPFVRGRYVSPERKKEFLENLLTQELLHQEAVRRGLDKDPEVQAMLERIMVQRLTRLTHEQAESVSDEEMKRYFEANPDEFKRPERIRANHVFIAAPTQAPKRAKAKGEADKVLADVKAKEAAGDRLALAELAKTRSDDKDTMNLGGDLGFKTRDELAAQWGPEVADAAFGLKMNGELSGVVVTDKGFHVLKLIGRQVGFDQSFEEAKGRIQSKLAMERRGKALETLVKDLKAKATVTIHEKVLEDSKIDLETAQPRPPMPGMDMRKPGGMNPFQPLPGAPQGPAQLGGQPGPK